MQTKASTQQQMLTEYVNQAASVLHAHEGKGGSKNLPGQWTVKPGLIVGSRIPAWQSCNFIYHASADTKSDMDAPFSATSVYDFSGHGGGSKSNTDSSGGGDSIYTVVLGPQVEQILHARAGKRRWIHRGGFRKKRELQVQTTDLHGFLVEEQRAKQGRKPRGRTNRRILWLGIVATQTT